MATGVPTEVLNQDVCAIARRLTAFTVEMHKSASAKGHSFSPADVNRLEKYLEDWRSFFEWVTAKPKLDLPHSHPIPHSVAPIPTLDSVQNPAVDDVVRYLETARDELLRSVSSGQATGVEDADAERHAKVLEKIEDFVQTYIKKVLPLDLPETTRFEGPK